MSLENQTIVENLIVKASLLMVQYNFSDKLSKNIMITQAT